jgi:DNA-binding NarL/FixJ family response regulator
MAMTDMASSETPRHALAALAVDDGKLAEDILGRFDPDDRRHVAVLDDPTVLVTHPERTNADTTILSFQVMRQLAKQHADGLAEYCHDHNVVLLIRSQEFLDSTGFLEVVNGVIFQDATLHRLKDILPLSRAGYSILPSAAVMDIVTDRLRCDTIAKLSSIELAILDQIRLARTNRAIARGLGLTEANVKTKVRAILKALKFQNRTEAAVFAARQHETIRVAISERTGPPHPESSDEEPPPAEERNLTAH